MRNALNIPELEFFAYNYKLTWPLRIAPEICGARNPIMFPTELVIPIKVPANLGAISS